MPPQVAVVKSSEALWFNSIYALNPLNVSLRPTFSWFLKLPVLIHNIKKDWVSLRWISFFSLFFFRDLLLPDGNRVSAFSVASTAIAAAQWSSSQVGPFSVYHLPFLISQSRNWCFPFQPQQSSEGMSEYSYLQEGYTPMSQVSKKKIMVTLPRPRR